MLPIVGLLLTHRNLPCSMIGTPQRFAALSYRWTPQGQPRLVHGADNELSLVTNVASAPRSRREGARPMDLTVWLPAMFLLGLAAFAFLFACVPACDKV